ncbi:MAG TPA: hypothetical protein VJT75_05055 [Thermoleophilaceae bacterium]|nr:hypothetical protein [Thermoleophilaceae bacterium]
MHCRVEQLVQLEQLQQQLVQLEQLVVAAADSGAGAAVRQQGRDRAAVHLLGVLVVVLVIVVLVVLVERLIQPPPETAR